MITLTNIEEPDERPHISPDSSLFDYKTKSRERNPKLFWNLYIQ